MSTRQTYSLALVVAAALMLTAPLSAQASAHQPALSASALVNKVTTAPPPGLPGQGSSTDPCGEDVALATCIDARGVPWGAPDFLYENDLPAACPSGWWPATYTDLDGITRPIWTVETSSRHWTTYWPNTQTDGNIVYGGVIDWNTGGHPWYYTLWAACTK